MNPRLSASVLVFVLLGLAACQEAPTGLGPSQPANVTVKLDFEHRPLPEIPLPNDLATRWDAGSPTHRRINASLIAPTSFEKRTRAQIDQLDGWGVYMPISVPFTGPIDVAGVRKAHVGDDFATADDVVYLIDVDRKSPKFGQLAMLDVGAGNFPKVLKDRNLFGQDAADARDHLLSVEFDEVAEDLNGNGKLDPGEDTDLDGVLDVPNYLPGLTPTATDLAGRADALMGFYERETNTLLLRPLVPLRERTTYAVVVTRRLKDAQGQPVGSPYPTVNHTAQTDALQPLPEILGKQASALGNLTTSDIAFAWTFTTGSMSADLTAVRDGLYGFGAQAHLAQEFPPDVAVLRQLLTKDVAEGSVYVLPSSTFRAVLTALNGQLFDFKDGSQEKQRLFDAQKYVDYHVFGSFRSPRLFPRQDAKGHYLSYHDMVWPPDLAQKPAHADSELVTFWITVPRKEISPRKDGKPAGVAILGHGYQSSRVDAALFGGSMAQHGLATISIDNVSHGLPLGQKEVDEIRKNQDYAPILDALGVNPLLDAVLDTRAWDQDLDGSKDSGADFWTAYMFHTRDVLRQTALDYMQMVRVLRAFDGKRTWEFDANRNGKADDLAGDFDGDGHVDLGGPDARMGMTGSSLGGIMAAIMAGCEPAIASFVPMCAGGGLGDVGIRSEQGGVREAVLLRVMGPLYVGTPEGNGSVAIQAVVPHLNHTGVLTVAHAPAIQPGDSVLAENLDNGEYDCARVKADLRFRVALASDVNPAKPQRHRLTFYRGEAFRPGVRDPVKAKACALIDHPQVLGVVDQFETDIQFHFQSEHLDFAKGQPLAPLAEGLGLHRGRPELRQLMGLTQLVVDPADPAVLASRYGSQQKYANGEVLQPHAIILSTVGDMAVPVATGAAIGRAAGWIDWLTKVPEWGNRTANQALIDAHVLEGVNVLGRYVAPDGSQVLADPEDLSGSAALVPGTDWLTPPPYGVGNDGYAVPRIRHGLHEKLIRDDGHGGLSGVLFPLVVPEGKHDIDSPGVHTDHQIALCKATAKDPASCDPGVRKYFDQGSLLRHAIAAYLASGGKEFPLHPCQSTEDCPAEIIPLPPPEP